MASPETVRYASAEDVLRKLDKDPDSVNEELRDRAKQRAEAATEEWIEETQRPFHKHRVGDPDEPRTWELYDGREIRRNRPIIIPLQARKVLPLESDEGDTLEVRVGRNKWRDITDQEGDRWDLDYRVGRLHLYRRLLRRVWFDDPNKRILRITYRFGPLGEDVEIEDEVVTTVPKNVVQAVAARAAMQLALTDENQRNVPDDGQLTDRSTKRSAYREEWDEITGRYSGFTTI